jgi:L-cysteine S-thiosulfotransferase
MVRQHYRRDVWLKALAVGALLWLSSAELSHSAMAHSLSGQPGDPVRGRAIAVDPNKGNCIICHAMPIPEIPSAAFGNIGPSLAGIGSRQSAQTLRQRIVDPKSLSADTIMPAYFATHLYRVQAPYAGKSILSAQEIEDVVAYLVGLK